MFQTLSYNFVTATLARVVGTIIGLGILGFVTRALGVDGFGNYSAIMAYVMIFSIVADLGLATILVREISQNPEQESMIVGKLFTLRLCAIILVMLIACSLVWVLPYDAPVKLGVVIVSGYVIFSSLAQLLFGVFQKHLKTYLMSFADVVTRIVQFGIIVVLVLAHQATLETILGTMIVAELVHLVLAMVFIRRLAPFRLQIDGTYWKRILATSLPIAVSLVFTLLYFRIDTVMLSFMTTARDVGLYGLAYKVLEVSIMVPAVFAGLIMPQLSKYVGQREYFQRVFERTGTVLFLLALPTAIYLYSVAPAFLAFIGGADFAAASPALRVLVIAIIMIFFGNLGGRALIACNLQKSGMWVYGAGAVFNIVTNVIFIPQYGYIAAAATTVATEVLVTTGLFWILKRRVGTRLVFSYLVPGLRAAVVAGVPVVLLRDHFILATLVALIYVPLFILFARFSLADLKRFVSAADIAEA